ncbi:DNA gyrase subunit A [Dietzia sp. ANT_WB102]|uniref:DNA gyrase subunit A n=1 Tax=Dietzia sp. ANT_WB102 TaxID=2597345 RepID=UPI0011EC7797|nr:DNA gyrase subunit A [Dietzia sp. ANT_WB102]KAA0918205.1 DNA gyrase subunit A [Dietzia sp. ANT_WB102]
MGASRAVGGWFEPGDEIGRAWDEAEAVLRACEDLAGVMATIRDADSPVEARRALKVGFGLTGRQAALLLTLPVMAFTRSERRRMDEGRRARMELLADVTGVLPAIPDERLLSSVSDESPTTFSAPPVPTLRPVPAVADEDWGSGNGWKDEFDGTLARIGSAMEETPAATDSVHVPGPSAFDPGASGDPSGAGVVSGGGRRSMAGQDDALAVLDEQIGELTDAIAALIGVTSHAVLATPTSGDDPRRSDSRSGALLDGCGVDDTTGIRTLLWHLSRSGLDSVEGLFPFAEPLVSARGFDVQATQFEHAMAMGTLGPEPGGFATWAGRLWPIAERSGYGYAVSYRAGRDAGSVWAYGGGQPLHRMWDSVVDLLVELYQAFTVGSPCDSALAAVVNGRVVWTNLG